MENIALAGAVLWTMALGTGAFTVAGVTHPGATAGAIDGGIEVAGFGDDVEVTVTEDGQLTARAATDSTNVTVDAGDDGDARVDIRNDAVTGGVERSATAGLCAVGLAADDSPVQMQVDAENDSVTADVTDDAEWIDEKDSRDASIAENVERCRAN